MKANVSNLEFCVWEITKGVFDIKLQKVGILHVNYAMFLVTTRHPAK